MTMLTTGGTLPITTATNTLYYWTGTGTSTGTSISTNTAPLPAPDPPPLEFNRFLNASDLLEDFIEDAGRAGVRQSEFLNLPIELFINWLIIKAAEKDGDPIPEGALQIAQHHKALPFKGSPRCLTCGRFILRVQAASGINWCGEQHLAVFMQRRQLKC